MRSIKLQNNKKKLNKVMWLILCGRSHIICCSRAMDCFFSYHWLRVCFTLESFCHQKIQLRFPSNNSQNAKIYFWLARYRFILSTTWCRAFPSSYYWAISNGLSIWFLLFVCYFQQNKLYLLYTVFLPFQLDFGFCFLSYVQFKVPGHSN